MKVLPFLLGFYLLASTALCKAQPTGHFSSKQTEDSSVNNVLSTPLHLQPHVSVMDPSAVPACPFDELPDEMLVTIAGFLPFVTKKFFQTTCKRMHSCLKPTAYEKELEEELRFLAKFRYHDDNDNDTDNDDNDNDNDNDTDTDTDTDNDTDDNYNDNDNDNDNEKVFELVYHALCTSYPDTDKTAWRVVVDKAKLKKLDYQQALQEALYDSLDCKPPPFQYPAWCTDGLAYVKFRFRVTVEYAQKQKSRLEGGKKKRMDLLVALSIVDGDDAEVEPLVEQLFEEVVMKDMMKNISWGA